jgi:hypothetical protein
MKEEKNLTEKEIEDFAKNHNIKVVDFNNKKFMLPKIVIPTYKRLNRQITLKWILEKMPFFKKEDIFMVVREEEYEESKSLYSEKCEIVSVNVIGIGPKRQKIHELFMNDYIFVLDDDISFYEKSYDEKNKKYLNNLTFNYEEIFLNFQHAIIKENCYFGGCRPATVPPDKDLPKMSFNMRLITNTFFFNPLIKLKLNFLRVPLGEDFDVTLQLLTNGYKNVLLNHIYAKCAPTQSAGGCSTYRTIENHNESQLKLYNYWKDFITLEETDVKEGPWKGKKKLSLFIYWKKAYKFGISKQEKLLF